MSYEKLLVETGTGITRITLNQPGKLNALSGQLLDELHEALQAAAGDPACRCVLLTGAGRGFSSGADLTDGGFKLQPGERFDFAATLEQRYHPVIHLLREMPKPVIAAVNGVAAGAGCNIALACDIVLAARSARFIQAFVRIGLIPDAGGTWSITRLVGRARAMRWMMTGDAIDADTAAEWGLVSDVLDDEQLMPEAEALAARLAKGPTLAIAAIKELVDAGAQSELEPQLRREADAQNRVGNSKDTLEGVIAFVQKREANFRGE